MMPCLFHDYTCNYYDATNSNRWGGKIVYLVVTPIIDGKTSSWGSLNFFSFNNYGECFVAADSPRTYRKLIDECI
ncbi:MAG: hypothetical protein DWB57_18195 [Candidatus Brocadia sp.]|nr:hypothetical protein [Candidatus Brocadia sp.]